MSAGGVEGLLRARKAETSRVPAVLEISATEAEEISTFIEDLDEDHEICLHCHVVVGVGGRRHLKYSEIVADAAP